MGKRKINNVTISISCKENLTDEQWNKVCESIKKHFQCWGFNDFDFNPTSVKLNKHIVDNVFKDLFHKSKYFGEHNNGYYLITLRKMEKLEEKYLGKV